MLEDAGDLKPYQHLLALSAGSISAVIIGYAWSSHLSNLPAGLLGLVVGFLFGYICVAAAFVISMSLENANKTRTMRQKLTEDEYYRMEARKRMDREGK